MDPLLQQLANDSIIKQCPNCGIWTEKISGCAFLDCSICHAHWCWQCLRIKYNSPVPPQNILILIDRCNDKSHNSH
jgi:hypothetical protein